MPSLISRCRFGMPSVPILFLLTLFSVALCLLTVPTQAAQIEEKEGSMGLSLEGGGERPPRLIVFSNAQNDESVGSLRFFDEMANTTVDGDGTMSDEHERRMRVLVRAAIATSVISLLFVGSVFGVPVTEVQCVVMMFLSPCAADTMNDAMNVARHFISPVQSMSAVDAIAFNIAFMIGVPILWFIIVLVFATCLNGGTRTFAESSRMFFFPGGPLLFSRLFVPGLWFNAFREIDGNLAALWCGVVAGLLFIVINIFYMIYASDLYYTEETVYDVFVPNTTTDVARSYFHVLSPGAGRLVAVWWGVLPMVVAGIICPKAIDDGHSCGTPWGFLVAIWWVWAVLWGLFRPHNGLVRSALYVALYLVCGIITLTIRVKDSTAQAVFSFFLLGVVILLLLHSALLWVYTFWVRDGSDKTIDTRGFHSVVAAQTQNFLASICCCCACCSFSKAEGPIRKGGAAGTSSPAGQKTADQELDDERAREQAAFEAGNAEYERSHNMGGGGGNNPPYGNENDASGRTRYKGAGGGDAGANKNKLDDKDRLHASKMYGIDGRNGDGSAFDKRRETEDERLAREYQSMLSGDARGDPTVPEPTTAPAPTAPPAKTAAVPIEESAMFSHPSAPAAASSSQERDADLDHLDPREKRRIQAERDAQEYYGYANKE